MAPRNMTWVLRLVGLVLMLAFASLPLHAAQLPAVGVVPAPGTPGGGDWGKLDGPTGGGGGDQTDPDDFVIYMETPDGVEITTAPETPPPSTNPIRDLLPSWFWLLQYLRLVG
ncbi:MAG: hypothetical protein QUU85_04935 [Candidatus Eisenbacteria bacterium]|nr:hypothetical protein [Candidatus Eisenbacteria bacterium]